MTGYIIGALLSALTVLILIVLVRTITFKPQKLDPVAQENIPLDKDKIVADMVDMVRCKTISNRNEALVDRAEFEKFELLLADRFPLIHKNCDLKKIGKTGLLYFLKGKSCEKPSVCMAHYDVVPINEEGWNSPAFEGIIKDGFIIGRGTIDTKSTLCGIMEALEKMLSEGFVPKNDLYLSFSGEEEIDGTSCPEIVSYLEENGINVTMKDLGFYY